jgi:Fe-S cluster assembly scaffold protein SufB
VSDLIPSRKDENYRYTQIPLSSEGWLPENLANCEATKESFHAWTSDFYIPALKGVEVQKLIPSREAQKNNEWIFLRSESSELKTSSKKYRGALEFVVPKGKSYKVFEFLESNAESSLLMRSIRVEEGAKLEYFVYQNQALNHEFVLRHFVDLAPSAKANMRFFHKGSQRGQHRVAARIAKDAEFLLEGATHLEASQHIDVWAEMQHEGATSLSQTTVWNVLLDQSSAVFNGMIRILKNCPQTKAYQSNKTLLLSEKARVSTIPKLEISTDDVKCSHGASVSTLDPDQLFYLRSRGISRESAQDMLVEAFTMPILQHIPKCLLSEHEQASLGLKGDSHVF